MKQVSLAEALREAAERNERLLALYRDAAHRSPSKTVAALAAAAVEQRRDLAEELRGLLAELGPEAAALPVLAAEQAAPEPPADSLSELPAGETGMDESLFAGMREAELADLASFEALSRRASELSGELGLRLASFAVQARKRADLAADHLDLLALGRAGNRLEPPSRAVLA